MVKNVTNKHTLIYESVKHISAKITSTQREYQIALNCKMEYLLVLIDVQTFVLLKEKIGHMAINLIFRELDKIKLLAKKFNQQVLFEVTLNRTLMVKPDIKCCLYGCKLPIRF